MADTTFAANLYADSDSSQPYNPPRYVIDLSLPPRDRYREVAFVYAVQLTDLTQLFDNLLLDLSVPQSFLPLINTVSRVLLRKVHDPVQQEELRGISEATNISMYLLVAFNVVLDLLMGCTSGGARALGKSAPRLESRMLHFRTLDWTMDPLRQVIVQLDYVRSDSAHPDKVLASSITYVGFVGVLTGVRQGLSMSLNFRAVHNASTKTAQFRFYLHHMLVLLGKRPSIATILRSILIDDDTPRRRIWQFRSRNKGTSTIASMPRSLADTYAYIRPMHTTAAYLIFSDGLTTICMEKDYATATMRGSQDFVAATNHDVETHAGEQSADLPNDKVVGAAVRHAAGLEELIEESRDRLDCLTRRWDRKVTREWARRRRLGEDIDREDISRIISVTPQQLQEYVKSYPTTNECTHFVTIMDPTEGKFVWTEAYTYPKQSAKHPPRVNLER